jgi:hypothetical protein
MISHQGTVEAGVVVTVVSETGGSVVDSVTGAAVSDGVVTVSAGAITGIVAVV